MRAGPCGQICKAALVRGFRVRVQGLGFQGSGLRGVEVSGRLEWNVGALIIRIGLWIPLWFLYSIVIKRNPSNKIGTSSYLGFYIKVRILQLQGSLSFDAGGLQSGPLSIMEEGSAACWLKRQAARMCGFFEA